MFGGASRYCRDASASGLSAGDAGRRHELWLSGSASPLIGGAADLLTGCDDVRFQGEDRK